MEKEMATHSSICAWRIPWTEEPGGLQSVGSQRVWYDWVTQTHAHIRYKIGSQWKFAEWLSELRLVFHDNLEGWDGVGGGREVREGGDIYLLMNDSCWCMAEINQHCKATIFQFKKLKKKKKKNPAANAGDAGDMASTPELGRSPGGGNGNPLQCSCLENPMGRAAWQATVHGVTKRWTRLSTHTHIWAAKWKRNELLSWHLHTFADLQQQNLH